MRLIFLLAITLTSSLALAESPVPLPIKTTNVQQLTRNSALIFSGTVAKVEHLTSASGPGITRITFRVESGIRGARNGQLLQVREWEGLWSLGERYRIGERYMLFLYPNSRLGLTSPVGGALGRYRVDGSGNVLFNGLPGGAPQPIHLQKFSAEIRRAGGN